ENSLIIPVRVHNPVSDSFATWPVAGKHDFRAVRRPFWLVTVDSGRLVSQLFPVGAIGIHHPDVSVPVLSSGPECDLGTVGGPRGGVAVRIPVPVWSRQLGEVTAVRVHYPDCIVAVSCGRKSNPTTVWRPRCSVVPNRCISRGELFLIFAVRVHRP